MTRSLLALLCLMLFAIASVSAAESEAEFLGSQACKQCHSVQYELWQASHHYQAMQTAMPDSVLGDFDNARVEFHGVQSRFFQEGNRYLVETTGDEGRETFEVSYTFGFSPLQQYLIEQDNGHIQALNIAWDSRPVASGGQRWFHLRNEMPSDSPFSWTRHFQNWNARCADCHSTAFRKNFDQPRQTYASAFAEINVACEACHGPASNHVQSIAEGRKPVKLFSPGKRPGWRREEGEDTAKITVSRREIDIDMCGGCHSRRNALGEIVHGRPYHDQYEISLLEEGLYYPDGQIDDEVFVLGSFMQSRMYQKGVSCMNCHDAHTGKVLFDDNRLCSQCHDPGKFDQASHAGHTPVQAACIDCHMPARTYMQIDDRRDHRLGIPDPQLSVSHGVPNACTGCHSDKSDEWAAAKIDRPPDEYADLMSRARQLDTTVVLDALPYLGSVKNPAIRRASLLANLPMNQTSVNIAEKLLQDDQDVIRLGAARFFTLATPEIRYQMLSPLLSDARKAIRGVSALGLADLVQRLPLDRARPIIDALGEVRADMGVDTPSGQTQLAMLELDLGRPSQAIRAFERSIQIEPHFIPALANLADLHRARGDEEKAMKLLKRAVEVAPDSGAANHALALGYVRMSRVEGALPYFKAATDRSDALPRYSFVYAVALESVGQLDRAIQVLQQANARWANQEDLLNLERAYRAKRLQ